MKYYITLSARSSREFLFHAMPRECFHFLIQLYRLTLPTYTMMFVNIYLLIPLRIYVVVESFMDTERGISNEVTAKAS